MGVYLNSYSGCCAAGLNIEDIFQTLLSGTSAVKFHDGYIDDISMPLGKIPSDDYFYDLIEQNIRVAIAKTADFDPLATTLMVGSSVGGMCRVEKEYLASGKCVRTLVEELSIGSIGSEMKEKFGFSYAITFSTACTSSSMCIDAAYDMISNGISNSVVVVGADELSRSAVNGFDKLGIASHELTKPFCATREGINISEGIAVLVLSNKKSDGCMQIYGCGTSSDAYNITHPHPEGNGAVEAMEKALIKSSLNPSDIGYINAHGTGTVANDEIECLAISRLFGDDVVISSTKSVTGHTLGACGALEIAICAMSLDAQILPPSINITTPISRNVITKPTKKEFKYALSNAFGFGGGNTSIVIGLPNEN